jgi:hypothetical protein
MTWKSSCCSLTSVSTAPTSNAHFAPPPLITRARTDMANAPGYDEPLRWASFAGE